MKMAVSLFLLASVALSSVPGFGATEEVRVMSCMINKLNSLVVSFVSVGGEVKRVELRTMDFRGENVEHVVDLSRPQLQLTEYGDVIMVSQDFGRSGYVFLRFERKAATQFDGLIDINFFPNRSFSTGGNLVSVGCINYEQ